MWFVVGCVVGELAGRWLTHFIYALIIMALLLSRNFC